MPSSNAPRLDARDALEARARAPAGRRARRAAPPRARRPRRRSPRRGGPARLQVAGDRRAARPPPRRAARWRRTPRPRRGARRARARGRPGGRRSPAIRRSASASARPAPRRPARGDDLALGARGLGQVAGELGAAGVLLERRDALGRLLALRPEVERLAPERARRRGRRARRRGRRSPRSSALERAARRRGRRASARRPRAGVAAGARSSSAIARCSAAAAQPRDVLVDRLAHERVAERARRRRLGLDQQPGGEQLGEARLAGHAGDERRGRSAPRRPPRPRRRRGRRGQRRHADEDGVAHGRGERDVAVERQLEPVRRRPSGAPAVRSAAVSSSTKNGHAAGAVVDGRATSRGHGALPEQLGDAARAVSSRRAGPARPRPARGRGAGHGAAAAAGACAAARRSGRRATTSSGSRRSGGASAASSSIVASSDHCRSSSRSAAGPLGDDGARARSGSPRPAWRDRRSRAPRRARGAAAARWPRSGPQRSRPPGTARR